MLAIAARALEAAGVLCAVDGRTVGAACGLVGVAWIGNFVGSMVLATTRVLE